MTRDNISVSIDASVYWRIVNPWKSKFAVENLSDSVKSLAYQGVRNTCGAHSL